MGPDFVRRVQIEEDLVRPATEWLVSRIEASIRARGLACIALCGGSTPGPVYRALAERIDWSAVHIYFGDERCVSPEDPESTYRLVRESLLDRIAGPAPVVHRMEGEDPDHAAAARRYARDLPERLDVALQGMGSDGHTASLFPGHPAVEVWDRRVVAVLDAPKPPPERLSLTLPVLSEARETLVLARGGDKAQAAARALHGPLDPAACPVQICRGGTWILDPAAAAALDLEALE